MFLTRFKKAILSALLINSKKKPYYIPQTLLFSNENNNEPSRMNYRSSTTEQSYERFSEFLRSFKGACKWFSLPTETD